MAGVHGSAYDANSTLKQTELFVESKCKEDTQWERFYNHMYTYTCDENNCTPVCHIALDDVLAEAYTFMCIKIQNFSFYFYSNFR